MTHRTDCESLKDVRGNGPCTCAPHALTREQCSLCTANRPRLCDQHYKQGADELLKHVTAAIQDQQTPGGVKATYEQLLELCNQQRQALAQQAQELESAHELNRISAVALSEKEQEVERLKGERDSWETSADEAAQELVTTRQQLATAQARVKELERTVASYERTGRALPEGELVAWRKFTDDLQATLAAREADIEGHVVRINALRRYLATTITERDAAVQDAARLRTRLAELEEA